jgi:hypothetical protein
MPMKHQAEWRDIPEYNGAYQISNQGEVRTFRYRKDRLMKAPKNMVISKRRSYCFVRLVKPNGKRVVVSVLRLMCEVWLGGVPPPGKCAYHKNKSVIDNAVENIGFITRTELGRMTGAESRRMPVIKYNAEGETTAIYPSAREAARANHMSYQAVIDRCHGKVKNAFALDGHSYMYEE